MSSKLQLIFKELNDKDVLIFLDIENYISNNECCHEIETNFNIPVNELFTNSDKFRQFYTEDVKKGWIWCYSNMEIETSIEKLLEDGCYRVEFGFNAHTAAKTTELGDLIVQCLEKQGMIAQWKKQTCNKILTIITIKDLPPSFQKRLN